MMKIYEESDFWYESWKKTMIVYEMTMHIQWKNEINEIGGKRAIF